jgi:membrane associated rhomboid family serine protease
MASFWDNLSQRFRHGNAVIKLLFINIGVFLALRILLVFLGLFKVDSDFWLASVQMPSDLSDLFLHPWTVFTYMFVHIDLMHILFNMLWLYFFGGMFLRWFKSEQVWFLYILGGLAGALFFGIFYNVLPAFHGIPVRLMGASASILALGIAVAIYRPEEPVPLFLFGTIQLKWLAIIMVLMDLLSLNGDNAGGNLAHLGGALAGLIFGLGLRRNADILLWIRPLINWGLRLFRPGPKMRVTYKRPKSEQANKSSDVDQEYRDNKKANAERLDQILDKIKKSGYDSLNAEEKRFLFESSRHS